MAGETAGNKDEKPRRVREMAVLAALAAAAVFLVAYVFGRNDTGVSSGSSASGNSRPTAGALTAMPSALLGLLPPRHLTEDAPREIANVLALIHPTQEEPGPIVWVGAQDPTDPEQRAFSDEIRKVFIDANWKGTGSANTTVQAPFEGVIFNQYDGPNDGRLNARFARWVDLVRRVVPMLEQSCMVIHNLSRSDSIVGSIVVGRHRAEHNPACFEAENR